MGPAQRRLLVHVLQGLDQRQVPLWVGLAVMVPEKEKVIRVRNTCD
ncbi:hypothetical protein GZL_08316 [Streptomyces sp. 769]|nr:hypothetical protein GZL_08316 [Streptomyces sp. 769]